MSQPKHNQQILTFWCLADRVHNVYKADIFWLKQKPSTSCGMLLAGRDVLGAGTNRNHPLHLTHCRQAPSMRSGSWSMIPIRTSRRMQQRYSGRDKCNTIAKMVWTHKTLCEGIAPCPNPNITTIDFFLSILNSLHIGLHIWVTAVRISSSTHSSKLKLVLFWISNQNWACFVHYLKSKLSSLLHNL